MKLKTRHSLRFATPSCLNPFRLKAFPTLVLSDRTRNHGTSGCALVTREVWVQEASGLVYLVSIRVDRKVYRGPCPHSRGAGRCTVTALGDDGTMLRYGPGDPTRIRNSGYRYSVGKELKYENEYSYCRMSGRRRIWNGNWMWICVKSSTLVRYCERSRDHLSRSLSLSRDLL